MNTRRPQAGERYQVRTPFTALVLTQFKTPFTGGHEHVLPQGLEFVVKHDPADHATGIAAHPQPYAEWERALVEANDLTDAKYAGYYLVISFPDLDAYCARVS